MLLFSPRERTEEDVELLVGATTGLKSFDKLSDYVHRLARGYYWLMEGKITRWGPSFTFPREICKVMYYEAFNTNTTGKMGLFPDIMKGNDKQML